jgi:hypothetical protein
MGSFQPRKVHIQTEKDKKFSGSQENELIRFFVKMLLFIP